MRLTKSKQTFEKGYVPNWTEYIFKVSGQRMGAKRKVYKVRHWADDEMHGVFYPEEVQKVMGQPHKKFAIESFEKENRVRSSVLSRDVDLTSRKFQLLDRRARCQQELTSLSLCRATGTSDSTKRTQHRCSEIISHRGSNSKDNGRLL